MAKEKEPNELYAESSRLSREASNLEWDAASKLLDVPLSKLTLKDFVCLSRYGVGPRTNADRLQNLLQMSKKLGLSSATKKLNESRTKFLESEALNTKAQKIEDEKKSVLKQA